eukprot:GDKJ01000040.1.p2 GENE.GDKJ01000040.1~~GDKJ01000040.1.p2  ORF type:complete len:134 (-),score=24.62 GDKJ01000040.1:458-859(-)
MESEEDDWNPPKFSKFIPEVVKWQDVKLEDQRIELEMNAEDSEEEDFEGDISLYTCISCFSPLKVKCSGVTPCGQISGDVLDGCYISDEKVPITVGAIDELQKCQALHCENCREIIGAKLSYTDVLFGIIETG